MPKPNVVVQCETNDKRDAKRNSQFVTLMGFDSWEQIVQNCQVCDKKGKIINANGKISSSFLNNNEGEMYIISPDGKTIVRALIVKASDIKNILPDELNTGLRKVEMSVPHLSSTEKVLKFFSKIFKGLETDSIRRNNLYEKVRKLSQGDLPKAVKQQADRIKRKYRPVANNIVDAKIKNEEAEGLTMSGRMVKKQLERIANQAGVPGMEEKANIAKGYLAREAYKDPVFVNKITRDMMNRSKASNRLIKANNEIKHSIKNNKVRVMQ